MTGNLRKIFAVTILASNLLVVARSEDFQRQRELEREQAQKTSTIWAGVLGAAVGGLLGYWVGLSESDAVIEYSPAPVCDYSYEPLSSREREVKYQLDSLAKYGQYFNIHDDYCAGVFSSIAAEKVIGNLYRLGIRLDQVDAQFYMQLAQENKMLSDAGYSIWWHNLKNLEGQKDLYLSNSNKIIAYFNRHKTFIRGCQVINYYHAVWAEIYNSPTIMIYPPALPAWFYTQIDYAHQYPLLACKNKIEADKQILRCLEQRYSGRYVVEGVHSTQQILDHLLNVLYNSYAYQQEVAQKQQDELRAEYNRIEQERLAIARQQARALEEANRLAAERNRLERERRDW